MRKTDRNLTALTVIFVTSIVVANVVGARTITSGLRIGPFQLAASGAFVTYAVSFLCTDIIGEIWGKAAAQRAVWYGFLGQIFAAVYRSSTSLPERRFKASRAAVLVS